jgi:hypothetical protein
MELGPCDFADVGCGHGGCSDAGWFGFDRVQECLDRHLSSTRGLECLGCIAVFVGRHQLHGQWPCAQHQLVSAGTYAGGQYFCEPGKVGIPGGPHARPKELSGSIPPELGNLSRRRMLSLHDNSLTGEIPPELGNCSSLGYLFLSDNLLSGHIPEVICKNLNLTYFDVSNNSLSGDITTGMTSFHAALCCLGCILGRIAS